MLSNRTSRSPCNRSCQLLVIFHCDELMVIARVKEGFPLPIKASHSRLPPPQSRPHAQGFSLRSIDWPSCSGQGQKRSIIGRGRLSPALACSANTLMRSHSHVDFQAAGLNYSRISRLINGVWPLCEDIMCAVRTTLPSGQFLCTVGNITLIHSVVRELTAGGGSRGRERIQLVFSRKLVSRVAILRHM